MNNRDKNVDPITFEILSHRLDQIAKEMGTTLERVGGTVNTTQQLDYMASLYRDNGEILATGKSPGWHVACAGFAVKKIIEQFEGEKEIYPDDVFLINDPYLTAIHQSDVYMISPIHYKDGLVNWSATFVHVMDIGAMSPGGDSPGATEIFHEGVRISGIKLVERGRLRKDVFDTIVNMTRQPVMVGLDLKCEMAANNVAKSRMMALYDQYGVELVDAVSRDMLHYSESVLRSRLAEIPDGTWEENAVIQADEKWNITLALRKVGSRLIFDFTGTDRQARVGINLPYHATFGACFEIVLLTLGHGIPRNHGVMRPIEVIAPEGTLVNVQSPGPVSLNTTSAGATVKYHLVTSVLMQMFATTDKWCREVIAHNTGQRLARHAGINQHGRYYASSFALSALQGDGARSFKDGLDCAGSMTHMKCPNVEWVELNFPILHLFRRQTKDAGGAGKFRGGVGAETAAILHKAPRDKIKVVAYGVAGLKNSGKGIFGGYPGAPSIIVLLERSNVRKQVAENQWPQQLEAVSGNPKLLPYADFDLRIDDLLYMRQASGGGYGDPLQRDPERVWHDVLLGIVSKRAASEVYGVVLDQESERLDLVSTENLRKAFIDGRLAASLSYDLSLPDKKIINGSASLPREILDVYSDGEAKKVRCGRCLHVFCLFTENWAQSCKVRLMSPIQAGPLMKLLLDQFLLRQLCCPACGTLLATELVEKDGVHDKVRGVVGLCAEGEGVRDE